MVVVVWCGSPSPAFDVVVATDLRGEDELSSLDLSISTAAGDAAVVKEVTSLLVDFILGRTTPPPRAGIAPSLRRRSASIQCGDRWLLVS